MEKFTQWSTEHDSHVAKRQGADKKSRQEKRNVPLVKKVETVAPVAEAPVAEAAEAEAPLAEATEAETPVAETVAVAEETPATEEPKTEE